MISLVLNAIFIVLLAIACLTPYLDYTIVQKTVGNVIPRMCQTMQKEGLEEPCLCKMYNSPNDSFCSQKVFDMVEALDR